MVEVCFAYSTASFTVAVDPWVAVISVVCTLALAFASLFLCCSGHSAVVAQPLPKPVAHKDPVVIRLPSGSLVSLYGTN